MASFKAATKNQEARTENGMKARASSSSKVVDLFYKVGASRGKDILPDFVAAYNEDRNLAIRIALYARDVRGGAGERKIFRDILGWLEKNDKDMAFALVRKAPELGRWDDIFGVTEEDVRNAMFVQLEEALRAGNGLAAKWTPRKGPFAVAFRSFLNMSPKEYRKFLVERTKVVETQMSAKDWDNINFSHVPSVAAARYRKAFYRNTPKYAEYVEALKKGDPKVAKVNASAIYPHEVVKSLYTTVSYYGTRSATLSATELELIRQQWAALPDYIGDASVMPLVDVSGSMDTTLGKSSVRAIDVAVALGMYCADKNSGKFKDVVITFTGDAKALELKGDVVSKYAQLRKADWSGSTNLHAAFKTILSIATKNKVPAEEMPETLLILSDMQFNHCVAYDDSAIEMIRRKYEEAGYTLPKVVFWNLNSYDNVPVREDETGTALVSGFSPSIMEAVLANDVEEFTPRGVMMKKIMNSRYDY